MKKKIYYIYIVITSLLFLGQFIYSIISYANNLSFYYNDLFITYQIPPEQQSEYIIPSLTFLVISCLLATLSCISFVISTIAFIKVSRHAINAKIGNIKQQYKERHLNRKNLKIQQRIAKLQNKLDELKKDGQ